MSRRTLGLSLARRGLTTEGQHLRGACRRRRRIRTRLWRRRRDLRFFVERPSAGSTATMDAAEEDGSGLAPHTVVVAPGEVAVKPVPHGLPRSKFGCLPYGNRGADLKTFFYL